MLMLSIKLRQNIHITSRSEGNIMATCWKLWARSEGNNALSTSEVNHKSWPIQKYIKIRSSHSYLKFLIGSILSHWLFLHWPPPLVPVGGVEAPGGRGAIIVSHPASLHVGLPHVTVEVDGGGDVAVHHDSLLVIKTLPAMSALARNCINIAVTSAGN